MDEEPASFEEAKGYPEWKSAMDEEIEALNKNQTLELVPKPKNCKLVTCKWVYRLKRKSDGTVDRCKARLVARGFSQSYGLDYEETYSPVAKMVTLRTIFSLAAMKTWKAWQLDIKNAFLYGELDCEVFVEQPTGYVSEQHPHHVFHLKKALYGLKKAPRAWYGKVAQFMIFYGFRVSEADSSLFIKLESNAHLLVLLYVDDMIITGNNEAEISMLKNKLSVRFEIKNLGELFNMEESREKSTPMEKCLKLKKDEGELLKDVRKFRQLVGSLIYLTITRPEISYAVGVVSQFMQAPRTPHLDVAKRILRYIKGTNDFSLFYNKGNDFSLQGYTNADWAGSIEDGRSISGYCFSFGSAAISWCSKKQPIVTLSSTEAEYIAATMAALDCVWLKLLMKDIRCAVDSPVQIYCDNQSAVKLASNSVFHVRTKHIEARHHFIFEKVLDQEIVLEGISSNQQIADIFTKALGKPEFECFRVALGVVNPEYALRGGVKNSASQ
ncbi:hypothetical protein CXB51_023902 [Gossypium anomalum]|uniref:Reverse transcriptase Ty1/copia-type domain-containing protein n=1 Tax=Gossypium anomalum TaxID=47600 RepID=A0A8J6CR23_9ROSI|nr:hypothetical protein CXB51_023902 [Gossypium anomalum]